MSLCVCLTGCDVSCHARHVVKMGAAAGTQQNGHVRLCRYVTIPPRRQAQGNCFWRGGVKIIRATFRGGPLNPARRSGGALWTLPAGFGTEPQPKSNSVHFILKIWQLVATVLMILLRINWSVYQKNISFQKSGDQNTRFDPQENFGGSFDPTDPRFPHLCSAPRPILAYHVY